MNVTILYLNSNYFRGFFPRGANFYNKFKANSWDCSAVSVNYVSKRPISS